MFSKLFEDRDKKISYLIKLGDCIGRSLRENVTLFSINSQKNMVTYLTESNKVISGEYEIGKDVILNNINIQDSSVFEDSEIFDSFVSEKLHTFVESIHYNEYKGADDSFADILSLWENRVKLDSIQNKLYKKTEKLQSIEKITEASEFQKLIEISPQLIAFLQENKEKISSVPEIKNAINLSNTVSMAFNFPKLTYDNLLENKSYILKDGVTESIYEMICRQELIKKELIESKKEFELIWASNSSVRRLASMIFEDTDKIVDTFCEALQEVPYIALASKKTLFNTFNNCLAQTDGIGVSEKDIQQFASIIFEMKKEVKQMFIESMNEKYGINVQNLQEPISFKSLINTQIVIFEALSRLSPKGGILKQVLSEAAQSLKNKTGIEGIDVNEYIKEVFIAAGYDEINEAATTSKDKKTSLKRMSDDFDPDRVTKTIKDMHKVIKSVEDKVLVDQEYSSDESLDNEALAAEEGKEKTDKTESTPEAEPEAAPQEEEAPDEPTPEQPKTSPKEDVTSELAELENMVANIAAELGMPEKGKDEEE